MSSLRTQSSTTAAIALHTLSETLDVRSGNGGPASPNYDKDMLNYRITNINIISDKSELYNK